MCGWLNIRSYCQLSLFIFFSLFFFNSGARAQDPPPQRINHTVQNIDLRRVLKFLSREYNYKFAYDPRALGQIKITGAFRDVTIEDFLEEVLFDSGFGFTLVNGTFVIIPKEPQPDVAVPEPTRFNFSLQGMVRDAETGESLPYASVSVKDSPGGVITNIDGRFSLFNIPTDTSTLAVNYLGYYSREFKLQPDSISEPFLVELQMRTSSLPPVEVYAEDNSLLSIENAAGNISFNPERVINFPGKGEPDVINTLSLLPGISGSEETTPGIRIRGGKTDESLILLDGYTVYHIDHFFGMSSVFNPSAIKNIQVYKGGYEAKYGGRIAGIIELTSIDGDKQKPGVSASINPISAQFTLQLPIVENNASLMVAARRSFTDLIVSPTYKRLFNNIYNASVPNPDGMDYDNFDHNEAPAFSYFDTHVKFSFAPTTKDAFALSFYKGEDQAKLGFSGRSDGFLFKTSDKTKWGNTGGSIKWSRQWSKKTFSNLILSSSLYETNLNANDTLIAEGPGAIGRVNFNQFSSIRDVSLKYFLEYTLDEFHTIEAGLSGTGTAIETFSRNQFEILFDSTQKAQTISGFLQHQYAFKDQLIITTGIRFNRYSLTGKTYWEPRVNVRAHIKGPIWVKGALGYHTQTIQRISEQGLYLSRPEAWVLSNDHEIPVLTSKQLIGGMELRFRHFTIDLEAFLKDERGISTSFYPEIFFSSFQEETIKTHGTRKIAGLDLLIKAEAGKHSGWLGYTGMDNISRFSEIENNDPFPTYNAVKHEVKLAYIYSLNHWKFSAVAIVASGIPYTPYTGLYSLNPGGQGEQEFLILGETNSENLPAYHRIDLSTTYSINMGKSNLDIGISIYNIYNNRNITALQYYYVKGTETESSFVKTREIRGIGFNPAFFLKFIL